jgi:ferredoxin
MTSSVGGTPAGETQESPAEQAAFSINFSLSNRAVHCRADQTILEAAEAGGFPIPFSCRQGMCGTCRSKLVAGRVDMKHAGGIRQRQIDLGFILPCCSRPLSDVTLER